MNAVIAARGLGKRYGRKAALTDCTLDIPSGHVVGLVGPNGAGKSTLLNLSVGLLSPTSGTIDVLGGPPAEGPSQLGRVGFVAQDTPTYSGLSVADHLELGRRLNPGWDSGLADDRIARLGLDLGQRAGKLSGGQRAQLALTLAIAKRPELLILDEPVASLDPLARREFLQILMETVAEYGVSVVLSSHLVADLERVCDYLVVLVASRLQIAGPVDELLASHHRLIGKPRDPGTLPANQEVIESSHTDRQSTFLVRTDDPILDPAWTVEQVGLEDLVLAYMGQAAAGVVSPPAFPGGVPMIWLAWRQFRTSTLVAATALIAVAVVAALTGPHLVHLYDSLVAPCRPRGNCSTATNAFLDVDRDLAGWLGVLVVIVPGLVGIFWGAPLVAREMEQGTFRLAWTQSVTRARWLGIKLAVVGLASVVVAGLMSLLVTWWSSPLDHANMAPFGSFDKRDIVPVGYAAFAFVLGVTAGMVIRRMLPAMATVLVAFVAVRLVVSNWVRPHFAAALRSTTPDTLIASTVNNPKTGPAGGWVLSSTTIDSAGHVIGRNGNAGMSIDVGSRGVDIHGVGSCTNLVPHVATPGAQSRDAAAALVQRCVNQLRIRDVVTYQPASRYWAFQWYETALFVGLALLLAGFCVWWIRRRLS